MNEWLNKYNPFNSLKALVHVKYWEQIIKEKKIPPPIFISIDPCGFCNFNCPHCNASKVLDKSRMTNNIMQQVLSLVEQWKVKAVCIGGGGESLLNPLTYDLIDELTKLKIDVGIVSNGSVVLDKNKLLKCKWIGFSIDAAIPRTYSIMKGIDSKWFDKVITNIKSLTNQGTEISYKYLLHPNNYNEIYEASKLAKEIGCNLIHIRPGAEPWFKDSKSWTFTEEMIKSVQKDIVRIQNEIADTNFSVYGITHKFNQNFSIKKSFSKCYACMTTCVINHRGEIGLCCDMRGHDSFTLCTLENVNKMWGSKEHFDLHNIIDVDKCTRCTYSHINEIFENVIINDKKMDNMY